MIKYNLICEREHEFESWFSNSKEFENLKKKKLLECIYCSSKKIEKSGKSKTPALDHFSRDITLLAKENKLDPVIGRYKEIERVAQILSRRKKNNPALVGEPGVGKTAIIEGLAQRVIKKDVPRLLHNKRILSY